MKKKDLLEVVKKIYVAGYWTCKEISIEEQIKLWTELRDAAGIPEGTATKLKKEKCYCECSSEK